MKFDILGAIFLDKYIYENDDKVYTSIGGSSLTIALGLHLLGHDVNFYGNIGNDSNGEYILKILKKYNFSTKNISIKNGYTGIFTAKNDNVSSVFRGVNDNILTFNYKKNNYYKNKYLIVTSEVNPLLLNPILKLSYKSIFFDIGPRPHLIKNLNFSNNIIKIGNDLENKISKCNIIKFGKLGASWGKIRIPGNNEKLSYTIGAGDLFDTILIDNYLKTLDKESSLKKATFYAEKSCNFKGGFKFKNFIKEFKL